MEKRRKGRAFPHGERRSREDFHSRFAFTAHCSLSNPYELFINCLPLSYATERKSIGMRKVINQNRLSKWEAAGGTLCFLAGIVAALVGSLLTAFAWIAGAEIHRWVHAAGTALLIAAIPLILFAGFCLDWAERGKEKALHDPHQRGAAVLAQVAIIATITGVALLAPAALHAQQTIFNVPTTDVLDRGKVYAELDVSLKPTDSASVNKFSSLVPRVVVGAGSRIEIGPGRRNDC